MLRLAIIKGMWEFLCKGNFSELLRKSTTAFFKILTGKTTGILIQDIIK
jgi:hypothetical protein